MLVSELNRNRRIGTEFEFVLPQIGSGSGADVRRTLAQILTSNGLPTVVRGYSHRPIPEGMDLAVEYDSSVRGESRYSGIQWESHYPSSCQFQYPNSPCIQSEPLPTTCRGGLESMLYSP